MNDYLNRGSNTDISRTTGKFSLNKTQARRRQIEYTVCASCWSGECWYCEAVLEGIRVSKETARDLGPVCGCRCYGFKEAKQ